VTAIQVGTNVTRPGQDGWTYLYGIRRDDGEEVTVAVTCAATAAAVATLKDNVQALESMKDHGANAALHVAEQVESPAARGRTHVRMFYSLITGDLQHRVDYERPLNTAAAGAFVDATGYG
jgi:hypothetical protein